MDVHDQLADARVTLDDRTPLEGAIVDTAREVEMLEMLVRDLTSRLMPVLRPSGEDQPDGSAVVRTGPTSERVLQVEALGERLTFTNASLRELIARIEA